MKTRFSSSLLVTLALLTLGMQMLALGEEQTPSIKKAPSKNQAEDQFLLGKAHAQGKGMEQSWEKAGLWYAKAAESGYTKAMVNLGLLYLDGRGTPKDEKMAYYWIHRAASLGDPRALGLEGYLLCKGRGCMIAPSLGQPLLEKGAELGDPSSQAMLGERLLKSHEKEAEAIVWLEKAAGSGNAEACLLLGDLFRERKTAKDRAIADGWYEKGAWLGHPGCQYEYSRILMMTGGAPRCYPWAKLAKQGGVPAANGIYWESLNAMSSEQRAAGDKDAERIRRLLP
jgi:TPR repeat protein